MTAISLPEQTFPQFAFSSFTIIFGAMLGFLAAMKIAEEIFGVGKAAQAAAAAFQKMLNRPSFSRAYVSAAFLSDAAFGSKLISLRALCVSFLASSVWLAVLCCTNLWVYGSHSWFHNPAFLQEVKRNAWFFLPIGWVIDFLALCLTRRMLLSVLGASSWRKVMMLGLNIGLTATLFYGVFESAKWLKIGGAVMRPVECLQTWMGNMFQLDMNFHFLNDVTGTLESPGVYKLTGGDALVDYMFPEGMLFGASLLTSLWFVAHVLAYWAYGTINGGRRLAKALVAESAIKSKPILSMSGIACIVALVPAWFISMLVWAAVH